MQLLDLWISKCQLLLEWNYPERLAIDEKRHNEDQKFKDPYLPRVINSSSGINAILGTICPSG
jgi:hypothetical protein